MTGFSESPPPEREQLRDAAQHINALRAEVAALEAEVATLRCVIRYANHEIESEWGEPMAKRIAFDLDDECAAAVRRATEETP